MWERRRLKEPATSGFSKQHGSGVRNRYGSHSPRHRVIAATLAALRCPDHSYGLRLMAAAVPRGEGGEGGGRRG